MSKSMLVTVQYIQAGCLRENTVYFRLAVQKRYIKMVVCTSNHCCIHLKWVSFSSGYLYKQGQLPFCLSLLDNKLETLKGNTVHFRLVV